MTDPILGTPRFHVGDRVRIRRSNGWKGPIIEWRGPLGPGGAQVYRVQIGDDPEIDYTEVREDQLVRLRPKAGRAASTDHKPADGPPPAATGA